MPSQEVQVIEGQLCTVKQVAAMLATTPKFVRTLITQRRLQSIKLSRRCVRVPRVAVEKLIRESARG